MEWAPGENGVVVVALAVVVVELAMVEVELGGAVVVVLAAMVLVEPVSEVVVEMAIDVVVVVIIEVVVVVFFFCADAVPGSKSRVNDRNTSQVFFMVLAPLLIEIHSADARGNVARGIAG